MHTLYSGKVNFLSFEILTQLSRDEHICKYKNWFENYKYLRKLAKPGG